AFVVSLFTVLQNVEAHTLDTRIRPQRRHDCDRAQYYERNDRTVQRRRDDAGCLFQNELRIAVEKSVVRCAPRFASEDTGEKRAYNPAHAVCAEHVKRIVERGPRTDLE